MLLAIPSPDLVVNLFASTGQVLGLLSVVAGGTAVSLWRSEKPAGRRAGRGLLWASLGLLAATSVAFLLYYVHVQDARTARLRTNLLRSSTEAGRRVGDASLATLSLSGQQEHPAGMSTADLRAALAAGEPLNLIDVRETAEVERGRIPGSWHVRYPDLAHDRKGLVQDGKTTVLLCFSGNRSSELADLFRADGIPCRFLIGGYEKWIAEGGALDLGSAASRDRLRALPAFPNDGVLLDTPDVAGAVRDRGAVFVDVRYPEEFAADHLPGAINLPLRKLRTPELEARLAALPPKPVIVPCYDRRSSFYALILGLELHRAGRSFLGRYTLPHEYFVAPAARAHVTRWRAQRAGLTLYGVVEGWLGSVLAWLQTTCGSLGLAILVLVVLIRGGLLPLSFKADVDQGRRRLLEPALREARTRFAADPERARSAILAIHRDAGLTPIRNLLTSVGQMVLFLAFFSAVRRAAAGSTETLLGIWTLGAPDGYGVLPAAIGVLMAALVCTAPVSRKKAALGALVGIGLAALTWRLDAAANLYLVGSLVWVLVQGRFARARAGGRKRREEDLSGRGVVTLAEAAHAAGAGNKAVRLGRMLEAGLPVPDGFAVTDVALERARAGNGLAAPDRARADRLFRRLGAGRVAVRSSGLNEDGGDRSYAGVFESVLDVTRDRLWAAIDEVRSSLDSQRARVYGEGDERGGIVVQAMVPADYAGVLFTEHPGCSGSMLVELVEGLGEGLVSGQVTPEGFAFTRITGRPCGDEKPPIDLGPLLELGRRVEELFGAPQDIEWAYAGGRFHLLQARDITAGAGQNRTAEALRERERARLLAAARGAGADEVVFAQNELSELLPEPTPFSLAFMNSLWARGGSVDLACRSLGVPQDIRDGGPDYVVAVFGGLFVDRREEKRRLAKGLGPLATFRLTRAGDALEAAFRDDFLPGFQERQRLLEAVDLGRLSDADLFALWREERRDFVRSTYVHAERINIAADFFVKTASDQLRRRGFDPAAALAGISETVVRRAFALLPAIRAGHATPAAFLDLFGHRARHDFEFAEPRYRDEPSLVAALASRAVAGDTGRAPVHQGFGPLLTVSVERARRFQVLKEEAKHEALRQLAVLRALTLEIGRRFDLGDRVFWLVPDEVEALEDRGLDAATLRRVEARRARAEACEGVVLPSSLTLHDLETLRLDGGPAIPRPQSGSLSGTRVAGDNEVVGRVRVLEDADGIDAFEPGEILVARFTDPTWSAVFPVAGGLITEVGGWLSHAAIQAREYGLPCIVDVPGAMSSLATGQVVRLGLDGSVERLEGSGARRQADLLAFRDRAELARDAS